MRLNSTRLPPSLPAASTADPSGPALWPQGCTKPPGAPLPSTQPAVLAGLPRARDSPRHPQVMSPQHRQGLGKPAICLQLVPACFQPLLPNETSHTGSPELPGCPSPPPPGEKQKQQTTKCVGEPSLTTPPRPRLRVPHPRPAPLYTLPLILPRGKVLARLRAPSRLGALKPPAPSSRPRTTAIYSWGSTAPGRRCPPGRPAHHPRERPCAAPPGRRPPRSCSGQRRESGFGFRFRAVQRRAAHTPARQLEAPGWVGLGSPGARCAGFSPGGAGTGAGSAGARRPPPCAAVPARPAAHLTLCRAPARGHGSAAAPPPADFLRSGARETTARGLPAAPSGLGAGAGGGRPSRPGKG